jgi:three-Cys-motif partner protein
MPNDRWPELCELVKKDDGLPVREVRHWTEEKLWFWNRYLEITTTAMVGKPQWKAGLVYVDLFGGPGVLRLKRSRKRIPGSPIIAAHAPKPFRRILVCEQDPKLADACRGRLANSPASDRFAVFTGDCNLMIHQIVTEIPSRALTLAFVDPTGLHAHFKTIEKLANCGHVDLLVLFADAYDIVRNLDRYLQQPNSPLDLALGAGSNWRGELKQLSNRSSPNLRKLFAEIFRKQLRTLGYIRFGERTFESYNRRLPLYRVIYASKHERGLEFWEKVTKKEPDAQGLLEFE